MALRTCAGCGAVRPKGELVRFVSSGGVLVMDAGAVMPGRGAYLCPSEACAVKALSMKGAFQRQLKREAVVPDEASFMAAFRPFITDKKTGC